MVIHRDSYRFGSPMTTTYLSGVEVCKTDKNKGDVFPLEEQSIWNLVDIQSKK